MNNPRISNKERNLLKGAIRRVFSRSDLRRAVIEMSRIEHIDVNRPRVKKWSRCFTCKMPTPSYLLEVDHVEPVVPVNSSLENMTWDELVNRVWCDITGLTPLCSKCHKVKTSQESKLRREFKKGKKNYE